MVQKVFFFQTFLYHLGVSTSDKLREAAQLKEDNLEEEAELLTLDIVRYKNHCSSLYSYFFDCSKFLKAVQDATFAPRSK